jgi:hypothetical protein
MDAIKTQAKKITDRINELQYNLSKSYSQSDPGAMMDRRSWRKEIEKLYLQLEMIHKGTV